MTEYRESATGAPEATEIRQSIGSHAFTEVSGDSRAETTRSRAFVTHDWKFCFMV